MAVPAAQTCRAPARGSDRTAMSLSPQCMPPRRARSRARGSGARRVAGFGVWLMLSLSVFVSQSRAATAPVPSEADSLINKAQAAYNRGDAPIALELANKAVDAGPSNPQAYWVRGRIYSAQAKHAKAIADYDKARSEE